ncbi:MAG: triose-phosphate isomerase [Gammaproteobacteria bacterium]
MRRYLIAGNWKMHGSRDSVGRLLQTLKTIVHLAPHVEMAVFPPFVFLEQAQQLLTDTAIGWGGQNIAISPSGAFTGEISAPMLRDFGCRYVILGHSERRTLFGETSEQVAMKCQSALATDLTPVICVGETLAEREQDLTDQVINQQLAPIFALPEATTILSQAVIAYEPVWAIGTGKTASPAMAQAVHAKIRERIAEHDKKVASEIRILYGGSLKLDNAAALLAMPDIDGGLIGGASLNPEEFNEISKLCSN